MHTAFWMQLTELFVFSFSFSHINMGISYIFFIKKVFLDSFLVMKILLLDIQHS